MLEACEDRTTPTPVVSASALSDAPEGSTGYRFQLSRDDTSGSLTVNLSFSGTADSGDFTNPMFASFMNGQATTDVFLNTTDDSTSEPTETLILTIASGSGYAIGSPASATINILDNDAQQVYVGVEDAGEDEDEGHFGFFRIGDLSASLTANFTVGGTATSGTDYTSIGTTVTFSAGAHYASKVITALPDNLVEGTESVSATVTTGSGYSVGSPASGTLSLIDDPATISVEATDTFEGAATGGFSFTRAGGNIAAALTVSYTITGTATSGTDFTALSGTVTFAAGQDRVEVWVEAFGDNTVDDAETVIATLTGGGTNYVAHSIDYVATVTIGDQPQTVSVVALTDGTEGGTNPQFRFTRAGDLSDELTVYYTVTGTATSGTDYTALTGSVTFAEDDDEVDVTVTLSGDSTGEQTETVTVTLDEAEEFLFGNDSDTVFVRDNDTTKVTWQGDDLVNPTDWTDADNWDTGTVPVAGQDVYFNDSVSNVNCVNVGYGISTTLYGLHIIGGYSGTLTLANGLTVGTFEQTIGTLQMLDAADDLLVTHALLWSGGTLGATDDGADVVVDGASARIDPPNTGSMSTSSTLRFIGTSLTTFLPGTLNFAAGNGLFVAADMKLITSADAKITYTKGEIISPIIDVTAGHEFTIVAATTARGGAAVSQLPLSNIGGTVTIGFSVTAEFNGHVAGGIGIGATGATTGPSFAIHSGTTNLWGGSRTIAKSGMAVLGGTLKVTSVKGTLSAVAEGDLLFPTGGTGTLTFEGNDTTSLHVVGEVTFNSGTYKPRVSWAHVGVTDAWIANGTFTIAATAKLEAAAAPPNPDNVPQGFRWEVVLTHGGFQGPFLPLAADLMNYEYVELPGPVKATTGNIRRK